MNIIMTANEWTLKAFVTGNFMNDFGIFLAAILTFAILSFLYKDNAVYKFAEHLLIGVSVGYLIALTYHNAVKPYIFTPLSNLFTNFTVLNFMNTLTTIIMILVGLLYFSIIFPKYRWMVRLPIAISLGVGSGYAIPKTIDAEIIEQLKPSIQPLWGGGLSWYGIIFNLLILIGILSVLLYFYFSIKHTGAVGHISKLGRYYLMVGFGASFGLTVMGRISLLIERFNFLINEWLVMIIGWF